MKKNFVRSGIVAAVLLAIYHLIIFLIPFQHTPVFWCSYVFTWLAFLVAGFAFYRGLVQNKDAKSKFYGFPIAKIGAIYWACQLIVGLLFSVIGSFVAVPVWIAVLIEALMLSAAVVGLVGADAVVEHITVQDEILKKDVALMRALQSKVNQMAAQCKNPDVCKEMEHFADTIRYSDPVSSEALGEVERDLSAAVDALQQAVIDGDAEASLQLCRKASAILAERNRLCKLNKA